MEWNYLSIPHFTGHVITRPCWETLTWIILQLKQQNCVRLCSRPWLPWGLLGLGLWYEACRVECVLFSLRVVVTPTISQPFTTPLILSTNLQNLKKKINISPFRCGQYSLIHTTVALPETNAHCLHLPGNYCRCYSKCSDFWRWNAFFSSHSMTPQWHWCQSTRSLRKGNSKWNTTTFIQANVFEKEGCNMTTICPSLNR